MKLHQHPLELVIPSRSEAKPRTSEGSAVGFTVVIPNDVRDLRSPLPTDFELEYAQPSE